MIPPNRRPGHLFDPEKGHQLYHEFLDEMEFASVLIACSCMHARTPPCHAGRDPREGERNGFSPTPAAR